MPPARNDQVCPPALLLGVLCAFVACCVVGRSLSRRNPFVRFERFHYAIGPHSLFYPTASQVRALGRELLDRDRIAVIVGGSSVLHGAGQRTGQVWTGYLQAALGDDYRVINLALPGCLPAEFGATAAEMLADAFPRLIFVTDAFLHHAAAVAALPPSVCAAASPVHDFYGYFFWDAFFKGLLPADATRAAAVRASAPSRRWDARSVELERGMRLDSLTYSRDLWTTLAYTHFSTLWFRQWVPGSFTRPRCQSPEPACWQQPDSFRKEHCIPACVVGMLPALCIEVAEARRLLASARLEKAGALVFPETLRGRTLLLPVRYSPYFVSGLSRREQADYRAAFPAFVRALKRSGFAATEVEADYSNADFVDACHLSVSGGKKLAAEVAPAIQRLAQRLGYASETGGLTPPARQDIRGLTPPARHRGRDNHVDRE